MTPERRIIAAAVGRLRSFIATGGRPYLTPSGELSVSSRRAGTWRRPPVFDQVERERADAAFFSACRHEEARGHITRAVGAVGVRQPLGHVVIKDAVA